MKNTFFAAIIAATTAIALPASAATPENEFQFHYQASDMETAAGRARIEIQLAKDAREYCRSGDGAAASLSQRRACEAAVMDAVSEVLSRRSPDWTTSHSTRRPT